MSASKVSFTIRRPTPVSRAPSSGPDSDSASFKLPSIPRRLASGGRSTGSPLPRSATSSPRPKQPLAYDPYHSDEGGDDDDDVQDELVTGFDQFGVQRCVFSITRPSPRILNSRQYRLENSSSLHAKPKPQGPLVIPALQNRDWREFARKRKQAATTFRPGAPGASIGADGSVGGLGTRDVINNSTLEAGLHVPKKVKLETDMDIVVENGHPIDADTLPKTEDVEPETEDQKAIRAILASADGPTTAIEGPIIDVIAPVTETDAYHQDMNELPDVATLDAYARVPVSQFGAALLRGMGWKEGTAASRTRSGPVAPYLPAARPALLGIGAKEWEAPDDGGPKKKGKSDRRYVPVVKKEKEKESARMDDRSGSGTPAGSGRSSRRRTPSPRRSSAPASRHTSAPSSRRASRSPSRRDRDRDRDRSGDRDGSERARKGRRDDRSQGHESSSRRHSSRQWDDDGYRRHDRDGDKDKKKGDSSRY